MREFVRLLTYVRVFVDTNRRGKSCVGAPFFLSLTLSHTHTLLSCEFESRWMDGLLYEWFALMKFFIVPVSSTVYFFIL